MSGNRIRSSGQKKSGHVGEQAKGESILGLRPKFSLEHLRRPYCLSNCTKEEQAAFAQRLHELSQLSWGAIFDAGRHGQGAEDLTDTKFHAGKPDVLTGKKIIAFRFNGKAPMVGFREREVFYIVWLDRDFTLYKHKGS